MSICNPVINYFIHLYHSLCDCISPSRARENDLAEERENLFSYISEKICAIWERIKSCCSQQEREINEDTRKEERHYEHIRDNLVDETVRAHAGVMPQTPRLNEGEGFQPKTDEQEKYVPLENEDNGLDLYLLTDSYGTLLDLYPPEDLNLLEDEREEQAKIYETDYDVATQYKENI